MKEFLKERSQELNAKSTVSKFGLLSLAAVLAFTGCTENSRAKGLGGNMNVDIPADKKLVTATWKERNLWYLMRQRQENEKPDTYIFQEKSNYGLVQGKVTFNEK